MHSVVLVGSEGVETPNILFGARTSTEIEAIFAASGEIILIESLNESGSELMLTNRTASLKLKDVPERFGPLGNGHRVQL